MPTLKLRLATVHEKDGLEALQLRASLENEGDRPHLLANPGMINLPMQQIIDGMVFLAERDGKTLGYASLIDEGSEGMELDGLFVEPGYWRQGIGRALVTHAMSFCEQRSVTRLRVIANTHAQAFYASMGFQVGKVVELAFGSATAMSRIIHPR